MATATQELAGRGEALKRDGIVIRTYDLWKTYVMGDQEIHAVSGVDIEIRRGEYVAIMGPSGSGKSTLMNLIGCLDTPTKGLYYLNGNLVKRDGGRRAGAHPQQGDWVRFSDFQSSGARHRAAQRRASADLRRDPVRGPDRKSQSRVARGGSGSAHDPQAQRAFRRPEAARGRGAGAGEQSVHPAGR